MFIKFDEEIEKSYKNAVLIFRFENYCVVFGLLFHNKDGKITSFAVLD